MTTTSLVEQSPGYRERGPASSRTQAVVVGPCPPRRPMARRSTEEHVDARTDRSEGPIAAAAPRRSPTAAGSPAMAARRWAFAFYGGLSFMPLGTIAATWFTP